MQSLSLPDETPHRRYRSVNRNATAGSPQDIYKHNPCVRLTSSRGFFRPQRAQLLSRARADPDGQQIHHGLARALWCSLARWRAPGSAPVADACGLAGGTPWLPEVGEAGDYQVRAHVRMPRQRPSTGPRATVDGHKDGAAHSPLSGYSGTVELTLPSQQSASPGRFYRFRITSIRCVLWHVARKR